MHRGITRHPERTIDAIVRAMSPADAEIIRGPEVREILIADITEAFRQGSQGAARDVVLLGRPWGFSLTEIEPEVHLWQGEDDTLVPAAMGRYQAGQIPHCHATLLPGEGRRGRAPRRADPLNASNPAGWPARDERPPVRRRPARSQDSDAVRQMHATMSATSRRAHPEPGRSPSPTSMHAVARAPVPGAPGLDRPAAQADGLHREDAAGPMCP